VWNRHKVDPRELLIIRLQEGAHLAPKTSKKKKKAPSFKQAAGHLERARRTIAQTPNGGKKRGVNCTSR